MTGGPQCEQLWLRSLFRTWALLCCSLAPTGIIENSVEQTFKNWTLPNCPLELWWWQACWPESKATCNKYLKLSSKDQKKIHPIQHLQLDFVAFVPGIVSFQAPSQQLSNNKPANSMTITAAVTIDAWAYRRYRLVPLSVSREAPRLFSVFLSCKWSGPAKGFSTSLIFFFGLKSVVFSKSPWPLRDESGASFPLESSSYLPCFAHPIWRDLNGHGFL